jgi:hypothetical protein
MTDCPRPVPQKLIISGGLSPSGPAAVPMLGAAVTEENLLRDLAAAYADSTEDDPAPTVWTPAQVQIRLVAAFGVLRRSSMTIGPAPIRL